MKHPADQGATQAWYRRGIEDNIIQFLLQAHILQHGNMY